MPNYQESKIYKLVCNKTDMIYYGSTTQPLYKRKAEHKKDFVNKKRRPLSSKKIIENGDYDIILVEDFPCERKEQLLSRERYYIDNNECINLERPITTLEEKKQYKAEWAKKNPQVKTQEQKQKEYDRKKEIIVCECGINICRGALLKHKKTKKHNDYLNKV